METDRHKVDAALPRLASALVHGVRFKRSALEAALVAKMDKERLALYVEFCAYDETPLPVMVREESGASGALPLPARGSQELAPRSNTDGSFITDKGRLALAQKTSNKQGLQKVLQTTQVTGLSLGFGEPPPALHPT